MRRWFVQAFVLLLPCALVASAAAPLKPIAPGPSTESLLKTEPWQAAPQRVYTPAEIDALLRPENPAALIDEDMFLRRVWLDLAGQLPPAEKVVEFASSTDADKRAKAIDELLASEAFAVRWARYWSDTIAARVSVYMQRLAPLQEEWLAEQLRTGRGWNKIVRDMLTAEAALTDHARKNGEVGPGQPQNGGAFFVATRFYEKTRTEGAGDAAAETARLFLGIQLQCAQCHDDRNGAPWQRVQFHQLAAYFGRSGGRSANLKIGPTVALKTWALVFYPEGEYEMTADDDPKSAMTVNAAFLTGAAPEPGLSDKGRRDALAEAITSEGNFWFSAAFVNRTWKELLGRGFYEPVDDMGPGREGRNTDVLAALAAHFRATDYDIRGLYRLIMNTAVYQRQTQALGQATGTAATAARPLSADVLWNNLERLLAKEGAAPPAAPAAGTRTKSGPGLSLQKEFAFDPSLRPERTLPQTLWLMNNAFIQNGIRGSKVLAAAVKLPSDTDAADLVYLHALGRRATAKEQEIVQQYVAAAAKRNEALEDVIWALINSPDFQSNR
jgi:hypothetical protein